MGRSEVMEKIRYLTMTTLTTGYVTIQSVRSHVPNGRLVNVSRMVRGMFSHSGEVHPILKAKGL